MVISMSSLEARALLIVENAGLAISAKDNKYWYLVKLDFIVRRVLQLIQASLLQGITPHLVLIDSMSAQEALTIFFLKNQVAFHVKLVSSVGTVLKLQLTARLDTTVLHMKALKLSVYTMRKSSAQLVPSVMKLEEKL